jgi:hypothetical protein
MKRGIFFGLLFFSAAARCRAESADGGQPAAWLKLGMGARLASMGQAGTALENGAAMLESNPAGLSRLKANELGSQASALSQERRLEYLGLGFPFGIGGAKSGVGLSVARFGIDAPIELRRTNTEEPDSQWFYTSYAVSAGLGVAVAEKLALGLGLRGVFDQAGDAQGGGFSMDLGALVRLRPWLDAGLFLKDALSSFSWNGGAAERAPSTWRLGFGGSFLHESLVTALELEKNVAQDYRVHVGAEWRFKELGLDLRAGMKQERPGLGLGYSFGKGRMIHFDYAISLDPALPSALDQRFSLGASFSPGPAELSHE